MGPESDHSHTFLAYGDKVIMKDEENPYEDAAKFHFISQQCLLSLIIVVVGNSLCKF